MAARFQKGFVPELDGLRAFAVLAVLWSHLPAGALGSTVTALGEEYVVGNVGVDLFFVLSGFLITRILLVDREREVPLRWFLARRFLRIFPIYYLTIAVVSPRLTSFETWASLSYTSNYAFIFHEEHGPLDHTWSLAVEEHFYLLWPPLVAFLAPRASRRALLLGIVPLAVLSVVLGLALWDWDVHAQALIEFELRSSTVRFFSLALGALLAFHETALRARRGLALGVAVGCAAACYLISERGVRALGLMGGLESAFSGGAPFGPRVAALQVLSIPFGSAAAVVLAFAFTGARGPFHALLRAAPLRWIGRISYGLYLYHLPIFFSEVWDVRAGTYQPLRVAAVVAVTFAVAWVSFQTFERLFLGFSARFREGGRDVPVPRPGWGKIALAALFAVGLAKTLNGGAPAAVNAAVERFSPIPEAAGAARAEARRVAPELTSRATARSVAVHALWRAEIDARFGRPYPRAPFVPFVGAARIEDIARAGHRVEPGTGAQWIDVEFLGDAVERAGDLGPLVIDYVVAHLAARRAQVFSGLDRSVPSMEGVDASEARARLAAHAEVLAGVTLGRLGAPSEGAPRGWDRATAARVLGVVAEAERALADARDEDVLVPSDFTALPLGVRVDRLVEGLEHGDIERAGRALVESPR